MEANPCLLLLLLFSSIYHPILSQLDEESSALLSIKSTLIDPLDRLRDWTPSTHHCNWTGVGCNAMGSVDRLDLSHMNLTGRVHDHLNRLIDLTFLTLRGNAFASPLPKSLPNLTRLVSFDVSENLFVGPFPSGLGLASGLTAVNASGNNFVGPLPVDIGNATSLESLDFRGSFFGGPIPAEYRNLKRLRFLGLSGNNLTGRIPIELGELASLETVILGYNAFSGRIPPELGNLVNLRYLDLAVGSLVGPIPPELGKLKRLDTVYLYKNAFHGEIPPRLGNASAIAFLDLSDNQLTGPIPESLARLENLQLLNLMCNRLSGPVPAGLGELPKLEVLELWNNSLTGPLPPTLGKNSPLSWLDVSSNLLSGEIPMGLCDMGNLTKLILFNNGFSGPIPIGLTTCVSLVRVRAQNNRINGSIPAGFGKLPWLQRLEIANNTLEGEIPNDITSSTSLSFIDLSQNRLQLSLPANVFAMPSLQSFIASDNALQGEIPSEFQDCPSLSVLDIAHNRLSGEIPASLASCDKLVTLNLRRNGFTGPIPSAIAMMPALAVIDLSENSLTGHIPDNFGGSPALEMLNVSYNGLSGPVPSNGVLHAINPDDFAGNPGLCGGVLPPCSANYTGSAPHDRERVRIKHILAGWVIGVSTILTIGVAAFGAMHLYRYWYIGGGCCDGRFNERNGDWPWRLTAFQRLSFTSVDVLPCIKESNVIGMGAAGIVYKAEIPSRHVTVAVKKLWHPSEPDGSAGDIAGEVSLLGRLRHRNIVRLLGYLHNETDAMIVYDYMPNGNLWEALHGERARRVLVDWVSRYNVAVGVAQGLAYLHHDCHPPVIHRDVKSNNILLDGNLEARIADFGLARAMLRKNETVSVVAGSIGYIAPEYGYTMKVDQKSDIYSFGVVLMELLTGRKPVEEEFGECMDIVGWIREKVRQNRAIEDALDANVGGRCQHVQEEMLMVLRIAILCTARSPKDRPSMRDVLLMLGEAKPRRKSSSASVASNCVKDKPVFTTSPEPEFV
ncbi:Leucine-rich repeat receptor-like protein kinase PXL2 [Acorus gramineus]|uniref:non-specific serine/threonine protein kinase n=1 Tax=Acorus gramineus TaxID=55184 RepID=A0AAV9A836_ACOGR|nr:Leucine-rich repeat receptor-like protein kinase PXL2 [Acorus gramineus]